MIERSDTNYIETFTGKKFWPLNPIIEDIDIYDIAHALSNKCRYTGHTSEFYSVAQHCVLVSENSPCQYALEALLHDAAEAYLPDLAYPLKQHFNGFNDIERVMHGAVAVRFGLKHPWPGQVKEVDRRITRDEAWYLMKTQGLEWPGSTNRMCITITPWSPSVAEKTFLEQYELLLKLRDVPDPWHFKRLSQVHAKKKRATK